ncbi:hypothetical protein QJS66_05640 [Kocuria rhizophila]|nr:hypothetical protein QJS66_05640 [Kocuria rhizophila]
MGGPARRGEVPALRGIARVDMDMFYVGVELLTARSTAAAQ